MNKRRIEELFVLAIMSVFGCGCVGEILFGSAGMWTGCVIGLLLAIFLWRREQ